MYSIIYSGNIWSLLKMTKISGLESSFTALSYSGWSIFIRLTPIHIRPWMILHRSIVCIPFSSGAAYRCEKSASRAKYISSPYRHAAPMNIINWNLTQKQLLLCLRGTSLCRNIVYWKLFTIGKQSSFLWEKYCVKSRVMHATPVTLAYKDWDFKF